MGNPSRVRSLSRLVRPVARRANRDDSTPLVGENGEAGEFDPHCDPDHPQILSFDSIPAAYVRIKDGIAYTPCTASLRPSAADVPPETSFHPLFPSTRSFKERGARNTLLQLSEEQRRAGVIAASAGNHALALCYHGKDLGVPVTVIMPTVAPIMKVSFSPVSVAFPPGAIARSSPLAGETLVATARIVEDVVSSDRSRTVQMCKNLDATVISYGDNLGVSKRRALAMAKRDGLVYVNG
ncbi:unnamed protein product [Darwinula stevensoni]|uniref:L-serine deaminase n=1 Tax=Darwinula stevensoni TaxID=69355 RepID=A0A7R9AHJ0_9CRUS|nr:unnamed protein product [Darwinula stevensoni]CAG0904806.1 unnamed protein product [Darwinula stevensoni]